MVERNHFPENHSNGSQRNGTNGLYYPVQSEADSEAISLHEILEVLFKNKWLILVCFVLVLVGVAAYTLQQAPEYQAESTIYINAGSPQIGELFSFESSNRNIANEIEIVKSRKIAMRVAEKVVDIERVPGTDQLLTVLSTDEDEDAEPQALSLLTVAQRLQGRINVQPLRGNVDIIQLTAMSTIPEEAKLLSTIYAEEYVSYNRELSRSRMAASREFLGEMTDNYRQELQDSENELTAFLNRQRVAAPGEEARELISRVSSLEVQQSQNRLNSATLQVEIRELEDQIDQIRPGLARQMASGDNLFIQRLVDQIAELEVQKEVKYAANPGLRENPSQDPELVRDLETLATLRNRLEERTAEWAQELNQEAQLAGSSMAQLATLQQNLLEKQMQAKVLEVSADFIQDQLQQLDGELSEIPAKDAILRGLQRSRETTEELYTALIKNFQEARIAEQSELGYVDILDEAIVPGKPVRPNVRMNLLIGAALGLILGIGLAFLRNAIDNRVRKPEDLRKLGYSVVGVVPNMDRTIRKDFNGQERIKVDGHEYSTRLVSVLNPLSPIAEGYRRVRTNLQFSRPDNDTSLFIVTSPGPSEGKTVTTLNLAVTMAQAGRRTLYLDADLRRPQGHRLMGIARSPGLAEMIFDGSPEKIEKFRSDLADGLYIIPAGQEVPNPAEVLGSHKMKRLLAHWRQEFDAVVIDTPPTLIVADALILAAEADGAIIVCSAGQTNWQAIERCNEALKGVGADVLGVLLNRFDAKAAYGGYKYGYGYGYEYGYGSYYYGQPPLNGRSKHLIRKA